MLRTVVRASRASSSTECSRSARARATTSGDLCDRGRAREVVVRVLVGAFIPRVVPGTEVAQARSREISDRRNDPALPVAIERAPGRARTTVLLPEPDRA